MKKRILSIISLTAALSLAASQQGFAGQWISDTNGWWRQENNGNYPTNGRKWIDGNGDGTAECYYFDRNGYCLTNTQTPDGYQVNPDGAWVINGIVQTQVEAAAQQASISQSTISKLLSIANFIYPPEGVPVDITASSMSSNRKASVLYRYQYQFYKKDSRIIFVQKKPISQFKMLKSDLPIILREIFAVVSDEDIRTCQESMNQSGNYYFVEAFEPEAADNYYLSGDNLSVSIENGRIKISGKIGRRYSYAQPVTQNFTAYFAPCEGSFLDGYCFERLIVQ